MCPAPAAAAPSAWVQRSYARGACVCVCVCVRPSVIACAELYAPPFRFGFRYLFTARTLHKLSIHVVFLVNQPRRLSGTVVRRERIRHISVSTQLSSWTRRERVSPSVPAVCMRCPLLLLSAQQPCPFGSMQIYPFSPQQRWRGALLHELPLLLLKGRALVAPVLPLG